MLDPSLINYPHNKKVRKRNFLTYNAFHEKSKCSPTRTFTPV